MTREEAIYELKNAAWLGTDHSRARTEEAVDMAIQALSQEPCTVSEKEPDEISEEISIKFFKNTLKLRWHDFVIYNVEWLKKNWQMEMDIVCGVKPCTDAISREAVYSILKEYHLDEEEIESAMDECQNLTVNGITSDVSLLPSVTQKDEQLYKNGFADGYEQGHKDAEQKSGEWLTDEIIHVDGYKYTVTYCSECDEQVDYRTPFCPECGARMVEPQESEDKE